MTGEEFKTIRGQLGFTQAQLGKVFGFGRPHIQQMESGRRAISRPVELVMLAMCDGWMPDDYSDD